jgi:hypothetical protein
MPTLRHDVLKIASDLPIGDETRRAILDALIAKFPKGEPADVPAYLREHGNPEAAEEWVAMNEEYGDVVKDKAKKQAELTTPNTLDKLVQFEAESSEYPMADEAYATSEVKREAEKFTRAVSKVLSLWVQKHPLKEGYDVSDLMDENGAFLVFGNLEGAGYGIDDGDWNRFFEDPHRELRDLGKFLDRALSRQHQALKGTMWDAAYETGGGAELEE